MEAVEFLVNVITVLILYGPAYLANTGAMLFGKWIPDDIPENLGISGYAFRSFLDVSIFEPQISLNEARRLQRLYRQETILAITQDGGVTLI